MNPLTLQTLDTSTDRTALKRAAIEVAGSDDQAALAALAKHLGSEAFLSRLDDGTAYAGSFAGLRLGNVLRALSDNPHPAARAVLLGLPGDRVFTAHVSRMLLLVHALAPVRPSPPQAIAWWDKVSQPGSPLAFDVAQATIVNESPPAVALFEAKCADPRQDRAQKVAWFRRLVLPRRNDEPLLGASERLLHGGLAPDLKLVLVEALFDYRPAEWYRGCDPPKPPARADATDRARDVMRRIADWSLATLPLSAVLRKAVELARKEIGDARTP